MTNFFGVLASIVAIMIMAQRGIKLYLAILAGIFIIVITNGFLPAEIFNITMMSVSSSTTITLAAIMITLTAFGSLLKETGNLEQIMTSISALIKDRRYQMMILPALIGLITFPGGAVFSAPLVEGAGKEMGLSNHKMALGNVMFRHMQYYIYPFNPVLILFSQITQISVYQFITFNLMLTVAFYILVFKYFFLGIKDTTSKAAVEQSSVLIKIKDLLQSLSPIMIILVLAIGFNIRYPLAILVGIAVAFINYMPTDSTPWKSIKGRAWFLWRGINWPMTISVVLILVYKDFLEHTELVNDIMAFLLDNGVSLLILVLFIPYLTGIITGSPFAVVGIAAALFLPIVPESPEGVYYLALVFISAQAGYLGSPLHMCTVLTTLHFKAMLTRIVKEINILLIFLMLFGVITFYVFRLIFV